MTVPLGGLDPAEFLAQYWQFRPLLIPQAFPDFQPELDPDDIAGLACEELSAARLVTGSYPEHDWTVRYGPFAEAELENLPARNWTLLVQDVEKHFLPLEALLARFSFIPSWRLDDLMVSIAAPGGSVGPHADRYDVFLLQASGERRWQISKSFSPATLPDCELNVLREFTPEFEWILRPGDMLYLPPGIAHHGVALESGAGLCMTWSIGLRAPSVADLFQALGEWLADPGRRPPQHYRDPAQAPWPVPGRVDQTAIDAMRALLQQALVAGEDFDRFIAQFVSQYRQADSPAPRGRKISQKVLFRRIAAGAALWRNPWVRFAWIAAGDRAQLFAAGEEFGCTVELAIALCSTPLSVPESALADADQRHVLYRLFERGYLCLAESSARD